MDRQLHTLVLFVSLVLEILGLDLITCVCTRMCGYCDCISPHPKSDLYVCNRNLLAKPQDGVCEGVLLHNNYLNTFVCHLHMTVVVMCAI